MARTKGSKNKAKTDRELTQEFISDHAPVAGNPKFNLNNIEPSETIGSDVAAAAVMPEDLELDRTLNALVADLPHLDDVEPIGSVVQRTKEKVDMLSDVVDDYKPATTRQEIMDQTQLAKIEGCDSIEATLKAIRTICRDPALESVGYFMYHDIKVYIEGSMDASKARDRLTIEQKLFSNSHEAERRKEIKNKIKLLEAELE